MFLIKQLLIIQKRRLLIIAAAFSLLLLALLFAEPAGSSASLQLLEANLLFPVISLFSGLTAAFFPSKNDPLARVRWKSPKRWLTWKLTWQLLISFACAIWSALLAAIVFSSSGKIELASSLLSAWLLLQNLCLTQSIILVIWLLMPHGNLYLLTCLCYLAAWLFFMSAFSKNWLSLLTGTAFAGQPQILFYFSCLVWGIILLLWVLADCLLSQEEIK